MEFKIQQKTIVKDHVYIIDDSKKLSTIDNLNKEQLSFATSSFNSLGMRVSLQTQWANNEL